MTPMVYSMARGKLIYAKNLKSQISRQTPSKKIFLHIDIKVIAEKFKVNLFFVIPRMET
jgi:hypothetical protein